MDYLHVVSSAFVSFLSWTDSMKREFSKCLLWCCTEENQFWNDIRVSKCIILMSTFNETLILSNIQDF